MSRTAVTVNKALEVSPNQGLAEGRSSFVGSLRACPEHVEGVSLKQHFFIFLARKGTREGRRKSMMDRFWRRKIWADERGLSLIEAIAAVMIVGTIVVATLGAMSASARTAARTDEGIVINRLMQAQIEIIQQSPFEADPADYPALADVPEGFSVSFSSSDPGPIYSYPAPLTSTTLTGVVQEIAVSAGGNYATGTISFFKISLP